MKKYNIIKLLAFLCFAQTIDLQASNFGSMAKLATSCLTTIGDNKMKIVTACNLAGALYSIGNNLHLSGQYQKWGDGNYVPHTSMPNMITIGSCLASICIPNQQAKITLQVLAGSSNFLTHFLAWNQKNQLIDSKKKKLIAFLGGDKSRSLLKEDIKEILQCYSEPHLEIIKMTESFWDKSHNTLEVSQLWNCFIDEYFSLLSEADKIKSWKYALNVSSFNAVKIFVDQGFNIAQYDLQLSPTSIGQNVNLSSLMTVLCQKPSTIDENRNRIAQLLLDQLESLQGIKDAKGNTPLHRAIENKFPLEIIENIIKKDKNLVNIENNSHETPLLFILRINSSFECYQRKNFLDIVEKLVVSKKEIDCENNVQRTRSPLTEMFNLGCRDCSEDLLHILLRHEKIDINYINSDSEEYNEDEDFNLFTVHIVEQEQPRIKKMRLLPFIIQQENYSLLALLLNNKDLLIDYIQDSDCPYLDLSFMFDEAGSLKKSPKWALFNKKLKPYLDSYQKTLSSQLK